MKVRLLSVAVPYLLLVSFFTPMFSGFTMDKLRAINESPFDGVAVLLLGAYSTVKPVGNFYGEAIRVKKGASDKDIWPWVFFNRFIGYDSKYKSHSRLSDKDYFREIRGVDIYDRAGALGDFFDIWRRALSTARDTGSPGIIVDPEAYNNYRAYRLSYIASRQSRAKAEVRERLEEIGAELADIVEEVYPDARIWFLSTGLTSNMKGWLPILVGGEYRSVTYVVTGMLKRARDRGMKLEVVAGGEVSLGYCFKDLKDLKARIRSRNRAYAPLLESYPNLALGSTIAPWDDAGGRKGWMTKGRCAGSRLAGVRDFTPLISALLESYEYLWIYAAGAAGYNPYVPGISEGYNRGIGETRGRDGE